MIFSNFYTLWIPERGHIWSQETSKQIKIKTQLNKFHVKTNNVKTVQVIFRLKYLKIEILSYFYSKNAQKVKFENFSQKIFCANHLISKNALK